MSDKMIALQAELLEVQLKIKTEKEKPKFDVAERLQRIRKQNTSYTQTDMAEHLGMSRTQYTNMETGVSWITVKNLIAVCRLLNTTPNDMLGFDDG